MIRSLLVWIGFSLFVCAVLTIFAPGAQAGPPLLCWPYDIGGFRSLPFGGDNWQAAAPQYDLSNLAEDAAAWLQPSTPAIVRMETLRRATIYAMKDREAAARLLARLEARVREAEARGKPEALALFDLGYLLESYKQAAWARPSGGLAAGRDGYPLIEQAIRLRRNDPEMEFAAALASVDSRKAPPQRMQHLEKAVAGAAQGSLLARNLVTHAHLFQVRGNTLDELRAQLQAKNR